MPDEPQQHINLGMDRPPQQMPPTLQNQQRYNLGNTQWGMPTSSPSPPPMMDTMMSRPSHSPPVNQSPMNDPHGMMFAMHSNEMGGPNRPPASLVSGMHNPPPLTNPNPPRSMDGPSQISPMDTGKLPTGSDPTDAMDPLLVDRGQAVGQQQQMMSPPPQGLVRAPSPVPMVVPTLGGMNPGSMNQDHMHTQFPLQSNQMGLSQPIQPPVPPTVEPPKVPPPSRPTRERTLLELAFEQQVPGVLRISEGSLSSKPAVLSPDQIDSALYKTASHTDGKPIYHLTNYRIFEDGDISKLYQLGGKPGITDNVVMNDVSAMGALVHGDRRCRVRIPKLLDWRIAHVSHPVNGESSMMQIEEQPETEDTPLELWVCTENEWFVLQKPDSVMGVLHDALVTRAELLRAIVRSLTADKTTTIQQVVKELELSSSGATSTQEPWWLWRLRCDRHFFLNYLTQHHVALVDTKFAKMLRDIVFSNEICASYPNTSSNGLSSSANNNRYSSIMTKYTNNNSREMQSRLEVVPADCDDPEAVRQLTDRCVVAVRGKYRGRSGYIVGAAKGYYIVSMEGEEYQIKGSNLELQVDDYETESDNEQEQTLKLANAPPEDGADDAAPVRRSVRLDPDFDEITGTRLVHKRVIIREGKLSGQLGKVASSGHGFYCVRARGMQVKLRRREFEVLEDDPSESVMSRAAIEGGAAVELKGVSAGSDNQLVGKTCLVKNGSHKGQVGRVEAYTYGIYSLHLLEVPDGAAKLLLLVEDLEELRDYDANNAKHAKEAAKQRQEQQRIEAAAQVKEEMEKQSTQRDEDEKDENAVQVGKRAVCKGGKNDGRVGQITGTDHGWFSMLFADGETQRIRTKDVTVLPDAAANTLPSGYESRPVVPDNAADKIPQGQARILVGEHAGTLAKLVSSDGKWTQLEIQQNQTVWVRSQDTVSAIRSELKPVQDRPSLADWVGKTAFVLHGLAAGSQGKVKAVLEERVLLMSVKNAGEIRVDAAAAQLMEPAVVDCVQIGYSDSCAWATTKDNAGVGQKWRGASGKVLGIGFGWVFMQLGGDEIRVRPADLHGLSGPPNGYQEEEDILSRNKRSREEQDSDGSSRPSSREQRPKRLKPEKKEEEEEEEASISMANAADGSLVKIRCGDHAGKTGVILWSGHGWINIKVGNEEVRIRSRDIAPADPGTAKPAGDTEASPIPRSKVSIRVGKHKGQTGKVLSSGHGWLWVQLGKEEVRVRRKDVVTISK